MVFDETLTLDAAAYTAAARGTGRANRGPATADQVHPDAVDAGELRLQHCHDCGLVNFPPRVRCPDCFAEMTWAPASGEGTVYSVGVVHRPNQPAAFEERLPVVLAVVELAEGPRLVSNVLADPDEVRVGAAVRVVFETVAAETVLPLFELVD